MPNEDALNLPFRVVIPARMGSSRFYAKPLVPIAGRAMVLRVVEQALASGAREVVVATDHLAIYRCVRDAGYTAHLTDEHHLSGTDRIAQVAFECGWFDDDIVVNVQGDEPAIQPDLIRAVAMSLHEAKSAVMSTAAHRIEQVADFLNPNTVKVVLNDEGNALYFSRAPIPYPRDDFKDGVLSSMPAHLTALRHMGIYAYRVGFLKQYGDLQPSTLELVENLEQLRVLASGHDIAVHVSDEVGAPGVDVPSDVLLIEAFLVKEAS